MIDNWYKPCPSNEQWIYSSLHYLVLLCFACEVINMVGWYIVMQPYCFIHI